MNDAKHDLTAALDEARKGRRHSLDSMMPALYDELRDVAARALAHEAPSATVQPTMLAHALYLRMREQRGLNTANRAQFLALAAILVRRLLLDHARARAAKKRGGNAKQLTLSGIELVGRTDIVDALAIEEALERLAALDRRMAKVVELRFFGGLSMPEVAAELDVSERTAADDWAFARAWLARELSGDRPRTTE